MRRMASLFFVTTALVAAVPAGPTPEAAAPEPPPDATLEPIPETFSATGGVQPLDPCTLGEQLSRLPACLEAEGCEAHELWNRFVGEPGLRVAAPQGAGAAAIQLAGGSRGLPGSVLRLPGGGEPSAARGPAGNLTEARSRIGASAPGVRPARRPVPRRVPCPAER